MKNLANLLIICCLTWATSFQAQYKNEVGISLGASNYLGDIGGKEETARRFIWDMKLQETNLLGGIYFRKKFNGYYSLKAGLNFSQLSGDDKNSENIARNTRNLRFKNNIQELSITNELSIFELNDVGNRGRYAVDLSACVFGGLNIFHHNPKGQLDGQNDWYELQPLQTEGVQYSKWGISIPAGLGVNLTYKRQHRFGWNITWNTTFTDYIDDISNEYAEEGNLESNLARELANQAALSDNADDEALLANFTPGDKRGDKEYNDSYMFSSFSYGYVIRSNVSGMPPNWKVKKWNKKRGKSKSKFDTRIIRVNF